MKSLTNITVVILAASIITVFSATARSETKKEPANFSKTELHFLFNMGPLVLHEVDDAGRTLTLTLDHFSTWRFGSNYFFIDTTSGNNYDFYNSGYSLYLEYSPALSLNKIFGFSFGESSPVSEISINGQINLGAAGSYEIRRAWLEGFIVNWKVPGFVFFGTYFLARQEEDYKPSWQITVAWALPFSIGPTKWEYNGFLDLWQRFKDKAGTEDAMVFLSQSQLLCNLSFLKAGEFFIGIEFGVIHAFPDKASYAGEDSSWDIIISPMILFRF